MELTLTPETERRIQQNIESGKYASPEEVVQAALIVLSQDHDDFVPGEWDHLLAEGEASIATQGTLDGDAAFAARRARRSARADGR